MERAEMNPTQRRLVDAVQAEIDRVLDEIGPRLDAHPDPAARLPENRNIQAAQNALRTCLEATLEKLVPWTERTPVEIGLRLASYALSALPIEAQAAATAAFLDAFPAAHASRLKAGIRLETTWHQQGRERSNFPKADA